MRVLVFGNRGQVGLELMRAPWPTGARVVGYDVDHVDITNPASVRAALCTDDYDLVVNAAAYTAVDAAEGEPPAAFAVNRDGPAHIARTCADRGAALIHISTDYVFDGTKIGAYVEDDPVAPLGVYGASKAEGETAVLEALPRALVLRTSWVYSAHGKNFVKTILRLAAERDELRVVDDQRGCPTSAADIAHAIVRCGEQLVAGTTAARGVYHYSGAGATTWHGFAAHVVDVAAARTGRRPKVTPIATSEYPTPARRPANSVLDCTRIARDLGIDLRPWRDSVRAVVDALLTSTPAEATA